MQGIHAFPVRDPGLREQWKWLVSHQATVLSGSLRLIWELETGLLNYTYGRVDTGTEFATKR